MGQVVKKTHVVMVGNMKGGVGKTTNAVNLGRALIERGRTVLLIDLDTAAGATKMLGVPTAGWGGAFELLTGTSPPEDCIITEEEEEFHLPPGFHLVPSSRELADLDKFLARPENKWHVHQDLLIGPIAALRGRYDYIFLDTPPNPESRTVLPAMKVADFVLLSAQPNALAVSALGDAMEDIGIARRRANPNLRLLGIITCAIPKPMTLLARELMKYVDTQCKAADGSSLQFTTTITRSTVVEEATKACKPIIDYAGDHKVADQYRALAKEFEARLQVVSAVSDQPAVQTSEAAPPEAMEAAGNG